MFYTMTDIIDIEKKFTKIMESCDASLAFFGIRIVSRLQCIRCGATFSEMEINLLWQHLELCKLAHKDYHGKD